MTGSDCKLRHLFLRVAAAGLTALLVLPAATARGENSQTPSPDRPNIILIMADQLRFDAVGSYGSRAAHTPNLDRLADQGVLFERAYVSSPICTPSRASLMTGKTVPGHGVYRLYDNLPEDQVLFTRRLQESGYRTALFGKLHVSGRLYENSKRHPNDGFDIYEWSLEPSLHMESPYNGYARWLKARDPAFHDRLLREKRKLLHGPRELHLTHWAAQRTIDVIEQSQPGEPFFTLMSVFDPHNPYEGYPLEMADLVDPRAVKDPVASGESGPMPTPEQHERQRSYLGEFDDFTPRQLRKMRHDYHANVALVDAEVGRVLASLEKKGIADNTLVIFTSDHGDMLGDHRLFVKGAFFYDPSVRVPLILRWPAALPAGKRLSQLVQMHDLAATVLAAAGVLDEEAQAALSDSHDLSPMARGEVASVRDFVTCTYRNTGIWNTGTYPEPRIDATMILGTRYKLNVFLTPRGSESALEGQLFDMQSDPNELHNLWERPAYSGIRFDLLSRLLAWETRQELLLGSRGGDLFPRPAQRIDNRLKQE